MLNVNIDLQKWRIIMVKKLYASVLQVVIGIMLGLFLGIASVFIFEEMNIFDFKVLFYILVMFFVSFILQIIVHEGGHCLFGYLNGFKFVSFRIGSYIWVNDNGKIHLKRYRLSQTGGQCLMDPPEPNFKSYVLYLLGGGIANLVVGIIFLILGLLNQDLLLDIFSFANIALGFLLGLTNLIPMDVGIPNDGLNVVYLFKERQSVDSLYKQLKMSKELADGKRIDEMDISYFTLYEKAKLRNPLNTCIAVNRGIYLSALKQYDEAKKCLEYLFKLKITNVYKLAVIYELILIELLTNDQPDIEKYLISGVKRKMDKEKSDLSSLVVQYGIELLVNKDERQAMVVLKYIEDVFETYPYNVELTKESIRMIEERAKLND